MESLFNFVNDVSYDGVGLALNGVWLGLLLTGLVWLSGRIARGTNAATRYAVWCTSMVVVVALPFLMGGSAFDFLRDDQTASDDRPRRSTAQRARLSHIEPVEVTNRPASGAAPETISAAAPSSGVEPRRSQGETSGDERSQIRSIGAVAVGMVPLALVCLWVFVSGWLVLRLWLAFQAMARIKCNASPLAFYELGRVGKMLESEKLKRPVTIATSAEIDRPVAAGLGKATILLPEELINELSEAEIEAVVLHELAHIRRYDDWALLCQKIVEAVLFFHPAVRWIGRQLDLERELSCDEMAMAQTGKPKEYYNCLTRLVQLTTGTGTSLVPGALTGKKQIFRRFERLLGKGYGRGPRVSRARLACALVMIGVTLVVAIQVAPVVAVPISPTTYSQLSQTVVSAFVTVEEEQKRSDPPVPRLAEESSWVRLPDAPGVPAVPDVPAVPSMPSVSWVPAVPDVPSVPSVPSAALNRLVLSSSDDLDQWAAFFDNDDERGGGPIRWFGNIIDDVSEGSFIRSTNDGGTTTTTWNEGRRKTSITIDGDVEFSDDDRSIKSLSEDGYLKLSEKVGGKRRKLEVEPLDNGRLDYGYYVNRKAVDFEDGGREWLAEILPEIIRHSGIGVEARVARFYKADGVDGVLAEIREIDSDWVKNLYFQTLIRNHDLNSEDFIGVLRAARRALDSDYEMAELLIGVAERAEADEELLAEFVEAVGALDSDYETRRVLSHMSLDKGVDDRTMIAVLEMAGRMDSDYEKAELLIGMAPYVDDNDELQQAYLKAIAGLDSDYETRRAMEGMSGRQKMSQSSLQNYILLIGDMDSDYEKAEMLIDLSDRTRGDKGLKYLVIDAAGSLDSDYEYHRVVTSQPYDCDTDQEYVIQLLDGVGQRNSSYEMAELLVDLSECAGKHPEARVAYLKALQGMDSDYETKRVLTELISSSDVDDRLVLDVLEVVARMDSDYEKKEVMAKLARYCRGNDELEKAFLDIVDGMSSEYDAQELYHKLYRRDRRDQTDEL